MKRMICLLLSACLLLALAAPVGAARTGFTDESEITHLEAVRMLTALGLISGYQDGSFRPDAPITREQIAKLVALLCTDAPDAAQAVTFTDVRAESWALPYIRYCVQQGIVTGSGGRFRPQDDVTAAELAKMLLVTLGYDAADYTGAQWAQAVAEDAAACGLYRGLTIHDGQAIAREDACQMILNALQSYAVHGFDESGTPLYVLDELMNPCTYLQVRYDAVRYTGVLIANEFADLTGGSALAAGMTRLAGYNRDFSVASSRALLGHRVSVYVRNGVVLGVPCTVPEEVCGTFTRTENFRQLLQVTDYVLGDATAYYYNDTSADASVLQSLPDAAQITVIDYDNDLTIDAVCIQN